MTVRDFINSVDNVIYFDIIDNTTEEYIEEYTLFTEIDESLLNRHVVHFNVVSNLNGRITISLYI